MEKGKKLRATKKKEYKKLHIIKMDLFLVVNIKKEKKLFLCCFAFFNCVFLFHQQFR